MGGALFCYECCQPNTFWTFMMLWRVFLCTSIASFTLSILNALLQNAPLSFSNSASIKFGRFENAQSTILDLPAAVIIGIICGLLGSFFIYVNTILGTIRKQVINTNSRKIVETCLFSFVTAASFYLIVLLRVDNCRKHRDEDVADEEFRFYCPPNEYNPLASLIFNTEVGTIRMLMRYPQIIKILDMEDLRGEGGTGEPESSIVVENLILFLCVWYIFTITTYGIHVPAGLFLPGILVGCAVGVLYLEFLRETFDLSLVLLGGQSYIIIGAAAMLSGYCRMTYSLAVLMLETTQSINIFLPILISIMVSHGVARLFTRSFYDYAVRSKQIPLLRESVPKINQCIRVNQVMREQRHQHTFDTVESVCRVDRLAEVLQKDYSTIPIVNMSGKLIGLIPKRFVIILIENHAWYEHADSIEGRSITEYFRNQLHLLRREKAALKQIVKDTKRPGEFRQALRRASTLRGTPLGPAAQVPPALRRGATKDAAAI